MAWQMYARRPKDGMRFDLGKVPNLNAFSIRALEYLRWWDRSGGADDIEFEREQKGQTDVWDGYLNRWVKREHCA